MTTIISHEQQLNLGRRYVLFEIDLREYGLGYTRVHEGDENANHEVSFGGDVYFPWPIQTGGWSISAQGRMARPTFALANTGNVFTPLVDNNNQFAGAPFRRIVTYERYLDGQPDADPTQHDPPEHYVINRVSAAGKINNIEAIQWELRAAIDRPNANLPRIQAIKGPCQFSYRVFDNGEFINGTCPYRGDNYFNEDNEPVTSPSEDSCAQDVQGCVNRHGAGNKLPYLGFVSVGDLRR